MNICMFSIPVVWIVRFDNLALFQQTLSSIQVSEMFVNLATLCE